MTTRESGSVEVVDLAPRLRIWRIHHPRWTERVDWQRMVTSVCADAGDEGWPIGPPHPPEDADQVWSRFPSRPPTAVAILLPDHLRPTSESGKAGWRRTMELRPSRTPQR